MKSTDNKKRLINKLQQCNFGFKIHASDPDECLHEEAEVAMVYHIIQYAQKYKKSVIHATIDDTDAFVLLVYWVYKLKLKASIYIKHFNGKLIDINATVKVLGKKCLDLLPLHATTGIDTNGYLFRKGKLGALNCLHRGSFSGLCKILGEEKTTHDDLLKRGIIIMHHLYGESKVESMTKLRQKVYERLKKPLIKSLPPTDENVLYHMLRAHIQVMIWKSANKYQPPQLDITKYGWIITNNDVMPQISLALPVPDQMMKSLACSCT